MQSTLMVYSGRPLTPATQVRRPSRCQMSAWVNDPDTISDKYLASPAGTIGPNASADLHFSNNYALEDTFDGGVLVISVDGGPFQASLQPGLFRSRRLQ